MSQAQLDAHAQAREHAQWRWEVVWLSSVYLLLLLTGVGLILSLGRTSSYVANINTGVLILSHAGMLTAGIIVGARWMLRELKEEPEDGAPE
jgi:hypothetical protein